MDFQPGLILRKDSFYMSCHGREQKPEEFQWELDRKLHGIATVKGSHKQVSQTAPSFWLP